MGKLRDMSFVKNVIGTINSRITYRMLALLVLALIVIIAVNYYLNNQVKSDLIDKERAQLSTRAKWMAATLAEAEYVGIGMLAGQTTFLKKEVDNIGEDPKIVYIIFYSHKENTDGPSQMVQTYKKAKKGIDLSTAPKNFFEIPKDEKGVSSEIRIPGYEYKIIDSIKPIETNIKKNVGWVRVGISTKRIDQIEKSLMRLFLITAFLLILLGVGVVFFIYWTTTRPILQMSSDIKKMQRGKLDITLSVPNKDELGFLADSFNELTANMLKQIETSKVLMNSVTDTISLIDRTTSDMFSICAQQSSGATEQAASVYEASSTSKEIAASATRISETAERVSLQAKDSSAACDGGKKELSLAILQVNDASTKADEVATRMVELGEKSQKISGIINIIKEISEQTNLLSLNASIEASGAGEAGKRFTVVAHEIRRLANRTLEATQAVRDLVEEIQTATNSTVMVTEQSMKSSKEAADIIDNMNQSFINITGLVDQTLKASTEITLSTRQQTTACEQMVSTIMEVSEVASEVEKGSKETEEALSKLQELSSELVTLSNEKVK
jgi:methyl-accepting chemotaxis protein